MKIKVLAGCVALIASSPAVAGDWWYVSVIGQKPKRTLFFFDKESLRRTGSKVMVWSLDYYETPDDVGIQYHKKLHRYDCTDQSTTFLAWIGYDTAGNSKESRAKDASEQHTTPIAPDTLGSRLLAAACGDTSQSVNIGQMADPQIYARDIFSALDEPATK